MIRVGFVSQHVLNIHQSAASGAFSSLSSSEDCLDEDRLYFALFISQTHTTVSQRLLFWFAVRHKPRHCLTVSPPDDKEGRVDRFLFRERGQISVCVDEVLVYSTVVLLCLI